ncbi:MAG: type II toxin-antitoxin system RelE/ParE family toxin [Eubacteriales bacterium]
MYTLEYLPIAMQDMVDIAKYISQKLSNPVAAERLANEMIESADKLAEFHLLYNPVSLFNSTY